MRDQVLTNLSSERTATRRETGFSPVLRTRSY